MHRASVTCLLLCALLFWCCDAGRKPFRFVVLSDTHLQLTPNNANGANFIEAGRRIAAMTPEADFVVDTGDIVNDLYCIPGTNCDDPLPALDNLATMVDQAFALPFYFVLGNHDDRYFDSFSGIAGPLASWALVFGATAHLPGPYYAIEHKGFTFIMLFACELASDHASNDLPGFSDTQLEFLDATLWRAGPAVVFWHHFIDPTQEAALAANPILAVLKKHKGVVAAVFSGHGHEFRFLQWEGISFYETANLGNRDDALLPYHLVEADPEAGVIRIVNASDIAYPP